MKAAVLPKTPLVQTALFRWVSLLLVLLLVTALSAVFVVRAIDDQKRKLIPTSATRRDQALSLESVLAAAHIVFRSTARGPTYGMVAAVPLDAPDGPRAVSDLSCERIYATDSAGICLSADRGAVTTYHGQYLNGSLAPTGRLKINGSPSRARLSADSSLAATTVFVAGHGYGTIGFSTETMIYSRATGTSFGNRSFGNLEKTFSVIIDGRRNAAADLNIWGVTFGPGPNSFYATVATGGTTWLAQGDLKAKTLTSIRPDAECPSLSPDGSTIVYKRRDGSKIKWRYHALDVASGKEWPLAETRSIDDQVEWLDDSRIVYGLQRPGTGQADVWVLPVRGAGRPVVLIPEALSPAVVR